MSDTTTINATPALPRIEIELDPRTGAVNVKSNVRQPVMFFGMIEAAKQHFTSAVQNGEGPRLVAPPPGLRV